MAISDPKPIDGVGLRIASKIRTIGFGVAESAGGNYAIQSGQSKIEFLFASRLGRARKSRGLSDVRGVADHARRATAAKKSGRTVSKTLKAKSTQPIFTMNRSVEGFCESFYWVGTFAARSKAHSRTWTAFWGGVGCPRRCCHRARLR